MITKSNFYFVSIVYLTFGFCISDLYSHTLILKDLRVIYGIIYSQDKQFVYLESEAGKKKLRKDIVGKIIIQDINDDKLLKKFLKKVKDDNPGYKAPEDVEEPPSTDISDIEYESSKILIAEIEEEERILALKEKSKDALSKSIRFPGWGEYSLGNKKTGIAYGSFASLFATGVLYYHFQSIHSHAAYQQEVSNGVMGAYLYNPYLNDSRSMEFFAVTLVRQQDRFHTYESHIQERNRLSLGLIAVYLIQLLHTNFDILSLQKDKPSNIQFGISLQRGNTHYSNLNQNSSEANFSISYFY